MFKKKYLIIIVLIFIITLLFSFIIYFVNSYKIKYEDIIDNNLKSIAIENESLNKSFVLSIIKAESKFNEKAKSSSDAFGLMQLTYPTAKEVAKKLNLEINLEDLFNPEINIKLGINYLNYLFSIYGDKQLVILSYNAGLNRVKDWLANNEIKIEFGVYQTPFNETNNYIKKVLANEKIYNKIVRWKWKNY